MEYTNNRIIQHPKERRSFDFRKKIELTPELELSLKKRFIYLIEQNLYERGKTFKIEPETKQILSFIFNWVLGKEIKVEENKGLLFSGTIGLGKSSILKATSQLVTEIHDVTANYVTANYIARLYKSKDDRETIALNRIFTCKLLFIDDIGTEDLKVYDCHPVQEVIRERYDCKRITSFTTNDNTEQLIAKYTPSIEDKISHMTYLINFKGESKRT